MIVFNTTILKFDRQGEKTGWTYIEIPAAQAKKLKPQTKVSFRVKGTLDHHIIKQVALIPMGDGNFIMPLNATLRKAIGKKQGDKLKVALEVDDSAFAFSKEFMDCLRDDPAAWDFFQTLSGSHQKYFSKWIDSAKTSSTKTKRIVMAVTALSQRKGFPEMLRENKRQIY